MTATGTETSQTPLQAFLDGLFDRDDVRPRRCTAAPTQMPAEKQRRIKAMGLRAV